MEYPAWSSYPLAGMRLLSFIGIAVHWIILQYVLGLPFMTFLALVQYIRTKDQVWMRIARTLAKGFVVVFAVGAATGTGSEFGLVLLWPNLTEAAGRYIYFPLYAEIFAFMMEVVFLYLLWYGWGRIPVKALAAVAFLGFLGAWYSAAMIVSVNSFMVAPTGIEPAVVVKDGKLVYRYGDGYPKLTVAVPVEIAQLLDTKKLAEADAEIVTNGGQPATAKVNLAGIETKAVLVKMPVRIVQQLIREAYSGVLLKDSILVKSGVLNVEEVRNKIAALAAEDPEKLRSYLVRLVKMTRSELVLQQAGVQLASPIDADKIVVALAQLPVKNVLDPIVLSTVKAVGVTTVTFKSPVYPASIAHVIGAGLVVSAFTAMAGFAMRLLRVGEGVDPEYRRYLETAFRFTAVLAAIFIAYQGFISGHEMGVAVAHYNPEKFAAMEGTAEGFTSIPKLLRVEGLVEKMMSMVAYGDPNVGLPEYGKILPNYGDCQLSAADDIIKDWRPPLILHYIYYTKVGLGVLLGLYGLVMALVAMRERWGWANSLLSLVGIRGRPEWLLKLAIPFAVVAQIASNMGWAVREIGRKPWTIYGMMTVDVAGTTNPLAHLAGSLTLVSIYYIAILAVLVYAVYKILWLPGKKAMGQA